MLYLAVSQALTPDVEAGYCEMPVLELRWSAPGGKLSRQRVLEMSMSREPAGPNRPGQTELLLPGAQNVLDSN